MVFNSDKRLVTCIIPTHNRADILPRSIDSVLRQTYHCFELLVVDNLSDDGTATVVKKYERRDSRVHYLSYTNSASASAARNFGLAHAKGFYIAFLDDDDEWVPTKLESQMPFADEYSVVGCKSKKIRRKRAGLARIKRRVGHLLFSKFSSNRVMVLSDIIKSNDGLSPSTMLVRTNYIKEIGGFDEVLKAAEGTDLFIRLINRFGPALVLQAELAVHHQEHGLQRISDSPRRMVGLWAEYEKNKHLMNASQQRFRLLSLYLYEMQLANDPPFYRKAFLNALRQLRWRELWEQLPVLARFLIFNGSDLVKPAKLFYGSSCRKSQ